MEFYNSYHSNNANWGDFYSKQAIAQIKGGPSAPSLMGTVIFREVPNGTMICAKIRGLPEYKPSVNGNPPVGPHGFHIHEMGNCKVEDMNEPFKSVGGHWNPTNQPHGNHNK